MVSVSMNDVKLIFIDIRKFSAWQQISLITKKVGLLG